MDYGDKRELKKCWGDMSITNYTVEVDENGRFYSLAKLGNKNLFVINLGEMVYDPNEEWE